MPIVEPVVVDVEKVDKEVAIGEATPTEYSVPEQAVVSPATLLAATRIWAGGPGDQVAG